MTTTEPSVGLLISQDLFFSSKVTGTARELGLTVESKGNLRKALSKVAEGQYGCLILDLAMPGVVVADVIAATKSLPDEDRPKVIAFCSHVHTARLEEARQAGCDDVMPRSKFSATLPELLKRSLGK